MNEACCKYYNGYKPCKHHVLDESINCNNCSKKKIYNYNILIIKTGAIGEVLRNTPLIEGIRTKYKNAKITWLTYYPNIINKAFVDEILVCSDGNIRYVEAQIFDVVLSLDKDKAICAILNKLNYKKAYGFNLNNYGNIVPVNKYSEHKLNTGIRNDLMKSNSKNYIEELFEICDLEWKNEKYIMPANKMPNINIETDREIIGINTGSGEAWKTRTLSLKYLIKLVRLLCKKYYIILLGGENEDHLNNKIISSVNNPNVKYYGYFEMEEFVGLVNKCDVIITGVTLAMHIAIAVHTKIILLNNIFPNNEFYLYNLGEIIEPDITCKYCYKNDFDKECINKNCMDNIDIDFLMQRVERLIHDD